MEYLIELQYIDGSKYRRIADDITKRAWDLIRDDKIIESARVTEISWFGFCKKVIYERHLPESTELKINNQGELK